MSSSCCPQDIGAETWSQDRDRVAGQERPSRQGGLPSMEWTMGHYMIWRRMIKTIDRLHTPFMSNVPHKIMK